jgi:hypothetical protein
VIVRTPKRDQFVIILKSTVEDDRLSWGARGILVYLLSKPDGWRVMVSHLMKQAPNGRYSVEGLLNELEKAGYIARKDPTRNSSGRFDGPDVTVYESPDLAPLQETNNGDRCRKPARGKPARGESATSKEPNSAITDLSPQTPTSKARGGRRGMRGSGSSPRELRIAATELQSDADREAELERLVTAVPATYGHLPEIAEERIRETFAGDPDRLQRSLAELASLTQAAS